MKPYLVSLAIGLLVGCFYALLRVRSPAPPVVALVGLLGMLVGEQGFALVLALLRPPPATVDGLDPAATHSPASSSGSPHAP